MTYRDIHPSITDEIIAFLFSARSHRIRRQILRERIQARRAMSTAVYTQSVYRLHKKGVLVYRGDMVVLSPSGKKYVHTHCPMLRVSIRGAGKVLVLFDIPEEKKRLREWLRLQLRFWDFTMVQKSAWLGKGPLPEEFYERLRFLGMEKNVKVFPVRKRTDIHI